MAAEKSFQRHPSPARGAIAGDCGDRIGRTARLVAAAREKDLRRAFLPRLGNQDHRSPDHDLRSRPKSRSTPLARPIITWSEPAKPLAGTISRASALKRRFIRLRMTAPPI